MLLFLHMFLLLLKLTPITLLTLVTFLHLFFLLLIPTPVPSSFTIVKPLLGPDSASFLLYLFYCRLTIPTCTILFLLEPLYNLFLFSSSFSSFRFQHVLLRFIDQRVFYPLLAVFFFFFSSFFLQLDSGF